MASRFSATALTTKIGDDYARFCTAVHQHTGLDLSAYKRAQMERRIRAMADQVGARDLKAYWDVLEKDAKQLNTFLDRITINVSEFFRNPEKFEELKLTILPQLLKERSNLSVWSAGCSVGAEIYSLRILLEELTPGARHRLLATDIDVRVLARARAGLYGADELSNVSETLRGKYFHHRADGYQINLGLRSSIEFQQHNLLLDAFPSRMDLILCRNVVIYFTEEAKNKLFARFYEALRPGGYLLVGSTESIFSAREIGFRMMSPFFYQRPVS